MMSCEQLGFLAPPCLSNCSKKFRYSYIWRIHKYPSRLIFASASSAPSLGGSGAEYSGYGVSIAKLKEKGKFVTKIIFIMDKSSLLVGYLYQCFLLNPMSPEQLLDVVTKKKKKGIAGIDQDELVDPKLLADLDSYFCEFKGVHIHHKIYDAESLAQSMFQNQTVSHQIKKLGFPMILLHGFGASVFSWKQVMKPLAEVTGSKVLAFDRPAFGLTSRVNLSSHLSSRTGDARPLNPYSMAFSVIATLFFIDSLNAKKAILVGHSAGSLVAVNTYFEAPERVAALILIAPAIFAPLSTPKIVKENQPRQDNQMKEGNRTISKNPIFGLYKMLSKITKYIAEAIIQMTKEMIVMLNSMYRRFLSAILRSSLAIMLVRMAINKFGATAVRNAWYDPKQVSDHVLSGYTRPLRTKDWDRALVEYTAAMLLDDDSRTKPSLSQRLHEISCPVLIVTGDTDRIVPSWNAERLSRVIPGASLEVIKQCGHLPHEEKVEEFISIVENFLSRLVGDSTEQYLQSVT